jgi:hypothetical protein
MDDAKRDEDQESESYDMSFVYETLDDGPSRLIRSIETHEDGSTVVTEYEDARPADDPYVRTRQQTVGNGPPREIVTEFAASPVRPRTYPDGFPFLANRPSWTTESPGHAISPGARWPCDDPDVVVAALISACLADGWTQMPASTVGWFAGDEPDIVFKRGDDVRTLRRVDHERGSVVQMLDLPGDWLRE